MIASVTLTLPAALHKQVQRHLFPGDGLEAAAILVCTRAPGARVRLLAKSAILVPHGECSLRQEDALVWPGKYLEEAIDLAETEQLAIFLVHSHPGGLFAFSRTDDNSDASVIPSLFHALGDLHGTAIMIPSGAMRARTYNVDMACRTVDLVTVPGNDIQYWWAQDNGQQGPDIRPVAFTSAMTAELSGLCAVVIGVSGTGSVAAEQAARLGFGRVILIDDDCLEKRNLNRIINSTLNGAEMEQLKVQMFADAICSYRGEGVAIAVPTSIHTREAVIAASQGDVVFCCVDSDEARYIADLISKAFLIPLLDVGVVINTRKTDSGVAIAEVSGRIDYIQPGGSMLRDRVVYSPTSLEAEYLRKASPSAFDDRVKAGYMRGLAEEAPSVISLNMRAASACIMEYIARAYPFRLEANEKYARTLFYLAACEEEHFAEDSFVRAPDMLLARGSAEPLLNSPSLKVLRPQALK